MFPRPWKQVTAQVRVRTLAAGHSLVTEVETGALAAEKGVTTELPLVATPEATAGTVIEQGSLDLRSNTLPAEPFYF